MPVVPLETALAEGGLKSVQFMNSARAGFGDVGQTTNSVPGPLLALF